MRIIINIDRFINVYHKKTFLKEENPFDPPGKGFLTIPIDMTDFISLSISINRRRLFLIENLNTLIFSKMTY